MTEKEGMTTTKAYEMIADKQNKEASTIRRDLERFTIELERKNKDIEASIAKDKEEQAHLLEKFMEYQGKRNPVIGERLDGDKEAI
ncbi:hypothetical protein D3C85_1589770 [compost metagenome]